VRRTDYNTSGAVATWKGGITYSVNDVVRLRATRSRDIRAPNANELFALGAQVGHFPILDPVNPAGSNPAAAVFSNGNSSLQPEKADTITAGIVLSPVSHLNLSLDYWDIKVHGAIISLGPQTIVNLCATSTPALCNLIQRDNTGQITSILAVPQNLQEQHIRGEDFELSYVLPLDTLLHDAPGNLSFHVLGNHIDTITLQGAGSYLQLAGSMEQPTVQSVGGQPHWRGNFTAGYTNGPLTLSATARYIGGGMLRDEWTSADINQLTSSSRTYLDLSIQHQLMENDIASVQLFATVVNALNKDPPVTGQGGLTTRALYDMIGRTYTAGFRFKF
jgi:iron complex outermembrane recepter protein